MLVLFRGLPGSGKTHLVRKLVRARPDLLVLGRDDLRVHLVAHPTFDDGEKELVDSLITVMAGFLVERGRHVVIDGMALSSASHVEELARAAEIRGAGVLVVECICAEATALARLRENGGRHPAGDRGEALYHRVKARWEPLQRPSLVLETDEGSERLLAALLERMASLG